jgi:hypothetical protein
MVDLRDLDHSKVGACKLCLEVRALRESHIISRWAYKALHDDSVPNPTPVLLRDNVAIQKPLQAKEPLLCGDCELLIKGPEDEARALVYLRRERAPIFNISGPILTWGTGADVARTIEFSEKTAGTLAYFGLSILWRSHVAKGHASQVDLGPRWGEHLRRVLRFEEPLHRDAFLNCTILDPDEPTSKQLHLGLVVPTSCRTEDFFVHGVMLCGFNFQLSIARRPNSDAVCQLRQVCLVHGNTKCALVAIAAKVGSARHLLERVRDSRPVGGLRPKASTRSSG